MSLVPWGVRHQLSLGWLGARREYLKQTMGNNDQVRCFDRVAVVAPLAHRNGIARGAQLQYEALRRRGIDAQLLDATPAHHDPFFRIPHNPATAYIFHSSGLRFPSLLTSVLPHAKHAYRIGYWAWELASPPVDWPPTGNLLSEIWTCSAFAKASLSQKYHLPIHVSHHAVEIPSVGRKKDNADFNVLVIADSRSSLARKNVVAAVRAFRHGLTAYPNARLVLKLNGQSRDVQRELEGLPSERFQIIAEYLDDDGMDRLFQSASLLLSLHRAEGFGLPMLEAMSYGIPCVATGWSGNLDFMDETNSILVPFTQVPVNDQAVYSKESHGTWAEADITAAAKALERLYRDRDLYWRLSTQSLRTASQLFASWSIPGAARRAAFASYAS